MAKLIGTGKDPQLIEGADFDVREEEVEGYVKSGLGVPVDPVTEQERIHPNLEKIRAEGGPPEQVEGGEPPHGPGEHEDNLAARVESTAPGGGEDGEDGEAKVSTSLSRDELNARAERAGVENPEDLPNKEAVVDAIRSAEGSSGE